MSEWWQQDGFLNQCVASINDARRSSDSVLRLARLNDALRYGAKRHFEFHNEETEFLQIFGGDLNRGGGDASGTDFTFQQIEKAINNKDLAASVCLTEAAEEFLQKLFQKPDQRLAMYGSLRRGQSNHHMVGDLPASYDEGEVSGTVFEKNGYPVLIWAPDHKERIKVEILSCRWLTSRFPALDQFEGVDYERTWIPVYSASGMSVCNVYTGRSSL